MYSFVADKLLYIYTSGTTGLPKAAIVINSRYCRFVVVFDQTLLLLFNDLVLNVLVVSFGSTINLNYNKCCTIINSSESTPTSA
jgi:acyl-CoA synthetase (AMP-forming)/AMP-acid ligase II